MQLIQHQELASAQSSIVFSDIPQTFTDLYLVMSMRGDRAAAFTNVVIRFNGSSADGSTRYLLGYGGSPAVESGTFSYILAGPANASTSTSSTFANIHSYIPNYAGANTKSVSSDSVAEQNATLGIQGIMAGLWNKTDAITSVTLVPELGTGWLTGSSASLFGVLAGSDGIVAVS